MAKTIYVDQTDLTNEKKFSYLSADAIAGAVTIGLKSTLGFNSLTTSSGQILCIGEIGQEETEIIKVSPSSTSTGSNIGGTSATMSTALRFDHPADTKVYIINWDRFDVRHASTISGTKSTLTAYPQALQPDQLEAIQLDSTKTSGYYFVRFNETIGSASSDWSDPIPYGGYPDNSVYEIKKRALDSINEKIDGEIITDDYLNKALWQLRREYHNMPGKRPFRRKFNVDIGDVCTGSFKIELPMDVDNPYTAENVYNVKIGTQRDMQYIDKKEWDFYYNNAAHTVLATTYVPGATDLYLKNTRDFQDSGSVMVEGTNVSYSAKSNVYGTMTISEDGDWSASIGSSVWQNISDGLPDQFTVWASVGGSAYIYFNRPISTTYVGQNIWCDYYRKVVEFDSDGDELDEPEFDMYVPGLAAMIKKKKYPNMELTQDADFQMWQVMKQKSWENEYLGTEVRLYPDIEHLL